MGMRGPKPKPSVVEIFEGMPGKRALNPHEPKPAAIMPDAPPGMTGAEKRHWRDLSGILFGVRVLTEADGQALAIVCRNLAESDELRKTIKKTGWLIKNPTTGAIHTNPLVAVEMQKRREAMNGLREFGCTPSSRRNVSAAPGEQVDPLEALCG